MNTISLAREGHIAHLQLQRPEKLNAQTHEMWFELRQVGTEIGKDSSIRALIVSGAGRSFSAGLDTAVLTDFFADSIAPDLEGLSGAALVRKIQESFTWLADAPYPTIAAVKGHALGAGCQLALACDLRVAGDDARFGLLETNWGLMPDLGGTVWLPELVGPAKAKEMMWLADQIGADEALRLGMVNRVVPASDVESEARSLAERLAARPPLAVTAIKEAVRASAVDPEAGLAAAGQWQVRCLGSNDLQEAGAAWLEQRPPNYTGT
ncbi:MAG: enoyl-CoA hydratase/isomerase family protein [Acidimicrobiales bacterium]|nr:enoyl-CoA hydratase/isomerase family protein [Acidimicrobiales bacterium]